MRAVKGSGKPYEHLLRLLFLISAFAFSGCTGPGGFGLWPIFDVDSFETKADGEVFELEALLNIIKYRETSNQTNLSTVILFNRERQEKEDRTLFQMIWPLYSYEREKNDLFTYLFPLFYYKTHEHATGNLDTDWAVFPLIFAGSDDQEGAYFGFIPFGGHLKGLLGKKWITFVMFPLYWNAEDIYGYNTTWAPFPFVGWGSGGGRESITLWPFYSHYHRSTVPNERELLEGVVSEPVHDHWSVLWPLIHYQENWQNSPRPETLFAFWPFYAQRTAESEGSYYFTPFFQYHYDDHKVGNVRLGYRNYGIFWPLIKFEWGRTPRLDEVEEQRVIPFYYHRIDFQGETTSVLWPIFWDWTWSGYDGERKYDHQEYAIAPLFWLNSRTYPEMETADGFIEEDSDFRWRFWPLFGYRRDKDYFQQFEFLSPIPTIVDENMDKNWGWIWRVFEYRYEKNPETEDEEMYWEVLWNLIRYHRTPDYTEFHALPFYSQRSFDASGDHSWNVLGGLFGGGSYEGSSFMRLLWFFDIPLG
ncbi:MAG: hypothetical protein NUW37_19295 [Planctomycetes bacterium]|nr:hypothetical protein [Planctomycetota bacterium]